jgi:hypothetical protein
VKATFTASYAVKVAFTDSGVGRNSAASCGDRDIRTSGAVLPRLRWRLDRNHPARQHHQGGKIGVLFICASYADAGGRRDDAFTKSRRSGSGL